jgi:hypothetical protein
MYCVSWLRWCVLLARSLYAEHPSAIQLSGDKANAGRRAHFMHSEFRGQLRD